MDGGHASIAYDMDDRGEKYFSYSHLLESFVFDDEVDGVPVNLSNHVSI